MNKLKKSIRKRIDHKHLPKVLWSEFKINKRSRDHYLELSWIDKKDNSKFKINSLTLNDDELSVLKTLIEEYLMLLNSKNESKNE